MAASYRFIRASALAPMPAVAIVALVFVVGALGGQPQNPEDDSPIRAAFVFAMLSPVLYIVASISIYAITRMLAHVGMLSLRSLVFLAAIVAVSTGCFAAYTDPFGPRDAAISGAIFAALMGILTVPTAFFWWRLAPNTPLNTDAPPNSGAPVS